VGRGNEDKKPVKKKDEKDRGNPAKRIGTGRKKRDGASYIHYLEERKKQGRVCMRRERKTIILSSR